MFTDFSIVKMYSNAVKITGLNDYLNPSEECVLSLVKNENKYEIKINDRSSDINTLKNRNKFGKNPLDDDIYKINNLKVGNVDKNKRITVGLSDCLSCSGCLTSSEEILLKDDNYLRVLERMKEADLCVVSISPQSIFMFSSYYDVNPQTVLRKFSYFFRMLGAKLVFDIGLAELISLKQSKEEFISKYLEQNNDKITHVVSLNNTNTNGVSNSSSTDKTSTTTNTLHLPIISSHCPGWTLYAEKTLDKELVDKISRVPSSQVIQGLLVKTLCHTINYYNKIYEYNYNRLFYPYLLFSKDFNLFDSFTNNNTTISNKVQKNDKVYHICIVPCYDKKFEMVRSEYQLDTDVLSLFHSTDNTSNTNKDNNRDSNSSSTDKTSTTTQNNKNVKESEEGESHESREIKEGLVDDILSTGDIGKILDEMNIEFEDLKELEIDYLFDYIYYFNKYASLKLLKPPSINNTTTSNRDSNSSSTGNASTTNNDSEYVNSYVDCLEKTNLRDLVRCSELYCQSGGFAEEIFRHSSLELFSKSLEKIQFKETINQDFKECVLYDSNNNVLLRFIIAYGFKNIQNIIRLLKPPSSTSNTNRNTNSSSTGKTSTTTQNNTKIQPPIYHYIELMSCPGGCFNGAGQRIERSLVDKSENDNFNDYFNTMISKVIPKKYQNSMNNVKLQISELLEKLQSVHLLKKLDKNQKNDRNNKDKTTTTSDNKESTEGKEGKNKNQSNRNKENKEKTRSKQVDIQATSAGAFEIFLKEAKYVSTEDPVCQYFSNFLKLSNKVYDFKLNLNSHKDTSVSLKW